MKRFGIVGMCCLTGLAGYTWICSSPSALAEAPQAAATTTAETTEASKATTAAPAEAAGYTQKELNHARETIKILDEVYKRIIILVTDKYVQSEDDFAAGSAAVLLFRQISAGDTHQVRLIDATGDPYEPDNVAKDDFEKTGIEKLKKGDSQYEQIVTVEGVPTLRIITAVPVVHERCVMCHDHYKQAKNGEPIGALSYSILIK